jgi:alpha-L-fucosidase
MIYGLPNLDEVIIITALTIYGWIFCTEYIPESYHRKFLCNYFSKAAQLNKDVVVNTKGTYFPTEVAVVNVERATMENITPDVWVTDFIVGGAWSYNKAKRVAMNPDKSIRMVADIVSKNGVVLFFL